MYATYAACSMCADWSTTRRRVEVGRDGFGWCAAASRVFRGAGADGGDGCGLALGECRFGGDASCRFVDSGWADGVSRGFVGRECGAGGDCADCGDDADQADFDVGGGCDGVIDGDRSACVVSAVDGVWSGVGV